MNNELYHYGVKNMHWGVRRWQNEDGSYKPGGAEHYYTPSKRQQKKNYKELKRSINKDLLGGDKFQKVIDKKAAKIITDERYQKINDKYKQWSEVADKVQDFEDTPLYQELEEKAEKNVKNYFKNNTDDPMVQRAMEDAAEYGFPLEEHRYYRKTLEYEMHDSDLRDEYDKKYMKQFGEAAAKEEKAWNEYNQEVSSVVKDMIGKYSDKKINSNWTYGDAAEMAVGSYLNKIGNKKSLRGTNNEPQIH